MNTFSNLIPLNIPFIQSERALALLLWLTFFWPIEIWEVGGKVVIKEVKLVALANSKEIILTNQVYLFTFCKDITNSYKSSWWNYLLKKNLNFVEISKWTWLLLPVSVIGTASLSFRYSIWQCNFLNTGIHYIYKHVLHRSLNILHETVNDMLYIIL